RKSRKVDANQGGMSNAYGAASCARAPEIAANATANAARNFLIVVCACVTTRPVGALGRNGKSIVLLPVFLRYYRKRVLRDAWSSNERSSSYPADRRAARHRGPRSAIAAGSRRSRRDHRVQGVR